MAHLKITKILYTPTQKDKFMDFSTVLNPLSLVGDIFGAIGQKKNRQMQEEFNQQSLDWQKSVQQTEWDRQDTAYQRTVEDLKAAGLSPLVASGGATPSGNIVATPSGVQAPQVNTDALYQMGVRAAQVNSLKAGAEATAAEMAYLDEEMDLKNLQITTDAMSKLNDIGLKGAAFNVWEDVQRGQLKNLDDKLTWDKQRTEKLIQAEKDLEAFRHENAEKIAKLQHDHEKTMQSSEYHNNRGLEMLKTDLQQILQSNELSNNEILMNYKHQLDLISQDKDLSSAEKRSWITSIASGVLSVLGIGVGAVLGQPVIGGMIGTALGQAVQKPISK